MTASLLTYLIQACQYIIVGSGAVSKSQFDKMNTSEIFETTKAVAPNVDFSSLPKDPRTALELFLMQNLPKTMAPLYSLEDFAFRKFIMDEKFNIPTVNPELKGYGAMGVVQIYRKSDNTLDNTAVYFGDYGIIEKGSFANIYGDKIIRQYIEGTNQTEKEYSGVCTLGGAFGEDNYILPKVKFIGDWRYPDGTTATDMLTFVQEVPASIGTVDVDGTSYDVNGDGTVTIGDNTIPINDDGSVTINGDNYYPNYDLTNYPDTSIVNIINQIIDAIGGEIVDDTTEEDEITDDILDNVEAPALGVDALDSMLLPKTISTVFPFCLPFDFVRGMKLFAAKPQTPHFEVNLKVPAFLNIPAQTWNIVVDLERFEMLARITRWLSFISFSFLLIQLSATIVKGAH